MSGAFTKMNEDYPQMTQIDTDFVFLGVLCALA
jgi:hypothetical protein